MATNETSETLFFILFVLSGIRRPKVGLTARFWEKCGKKPQSCKNYTARNLLEANKQLSRGWIRAHDLRSDVEARIPPLFSQSETPNPDTGPQNPCIDSWRFQSLYSDDMIPTLVQWIHVGTAVVGVGGIGFLLLVLLPSTRALNPEQRDLLMKAVQGKFRWISWSVIVLLLGSGLYNARQVWEVPPGVYWNFLKLKIALAFAVFTISLCLTLPLKVFDLFRTRRKLWLSVAFALAMAVILISAYLRRA